MLAQPHWTASRGAPPKSIPTAILSRASGATAQQIVHSSTKPARPFKAAPSSTSFAVFHSDTKEFNTSPAQQRMTLTPGALHKLTLMEISFRVTGVDASATRSTLLAPAMMLQHELMMVHSERNFKKFQF